MKNILSFSFLFFLACGYVPTAKAQDPVMHTYELQAPGKNPQTFIYYEDEAAWLMIKTNLVNKQIYFVDKKLAHTLVIIEEPFVDLMPLFIKEDINASSELGSDEYTLTKIAETASRPEVVYELHVHQENQTYRLTVDPGVEMTYTPYALHTICPALRPLGLITQVERPDGTVETLVKGEDSPAVVADAIEKVRTVLADESYFDSKIIQEDYGVSSFQELAEKMRARFKEMGY